MIFKDHVNFMKFSFSGNAPQVEETATSKEGLKEIARMVWNPITPEDLKSLFKSMTWRIQALYNTLGGHTKY